VLLCALFFLAVVAAEVIEHMSLPESTACRILRDIVTKPRCLLELVEVFSGVLESTNKNYRVSRDNRAKAPALWRFAYCGIDRAAAIA